MGDVSDAFTTESRVSVRSVELFLMFSLILPHTLLYFNQDD